MNCAEFGGVVHDLERTGTPGFLGRAAALEHAEGCAHCNALLEKVMLLDFALDAIAMDDRAIQAPSQIETALMAALRKQRLAMATSARNLWLTAPLALAAAAALAIALGIGHLLTNPHVTGHRQQSNSDKAQQQVAAIVPAGAVAAEPAEGASTDADPTEYATNFVSLPFADDPNSLEGGTVVRVMLTREALASFGFPVADVNPNELIPADIALSVDGVPQAIRLLADENPDQTN